MTDQPMTAHPAGTTDDEFDSLIEDACLPWKMVPLCLNGTLRREYEEIKARVAERAAKRAAERTAAAIAARNDSRLGSKGPQDEPNEPDPEQGRLDELVAQMRAQTVKIVVRAVPTREYNKILEKHPPRRSPATGRIDERDYQGFNAGSFYPELVRASIAQPAMTDARWKAFEAALTDGQFDKLANAVVEVNRKDDADVPFSPGDSEPTPS